MRIISSLIQVRSLSALFATVVLIAGLTACGGGGSLQSGGAGGGDQLRIATETDLVQSDNIQIRVTWDRLMMGSTVFEPLFTSDKDGAPSPALAKEATASPDLKTWTITLQDGVKFQNGKDFTANDVKANFDAIQDKANASALAGDFDNIASIDVVDPTTAVFHLKLPDNALDASLTDTAFMGDMDARTKMGEKEWAAHPVGTGPYEWDSRTVGDNLTFKRFDGYWRGKPPLASVLFRIIPDANVATLALQNGDVDVLTNFVSSESLEKLKADDKLQVQSVPSNTFYNTFLTFASPRADEYKDVHAMHEGLAYLFNAEAIVPKVVGDFGAYANQPLPPWQEGHDPSLQPFPFDKDKGVALLTQAGFPPGSTLKFVVRNAPSLCDIATAIQSQIQQIGYKVDLTCSDADNAGIGPNYEWDALFTRSSGRATASVFYKDRWRKSLAEAADDYYSFKNDDLENIINEMPSQANKDQEVKLAQQAAQIIVKQDVADIPLYWSNAFLISNKRVKGLVLSPLGWQSMLMNSYTTVTLDGNGD